MMDHDEEDSVPLVEKEISPDPVEHEETNRWDFLVLTIPFFGLQLAWTIQQVFGVPYLSSLGIPDTQMPIFVLSGPLAGLVGPPVVAALSDTYQGERKPFIFLGGGGTILSFLLLAAAQPLAVTLTYKSPNAATTTSHVIAGLAIYALNFSIQPLQLGLRASVVDHFGPHQQPRANLWISRFSALGSVFVALVGLAYSPAFWDLSIVVTSTLALLLGVVAMTDTKNPPDCRKDAGPISLRTHVSRLLHKARNLPPVTRRTCRVQLVSWFAWFLVLNYTSALIARIYDDDDDAAAPAAVPLVALLFHTASLATLLLVSTLRQRSPADAAPPHDGSGLARVRDVLARRVWQPSLAALAASLVGTTVLASAPSFPATRRAAALLLGANGVLFALANWVPYALIAAEAAARARGAGEEEDEDEDEDDTPRLLAVHNMAITVPQVVASVASWVVMRGLEGLGVEGGVVWVFVLCVPAAVWAACL